MREEYTSFYANTTAIYAKLLAPLADEMIQSTTTKDGKPAITVNTIGKKVENFKTTLTTTVADLSPLWEEWEQVQGEILKLGIEVLGAEAFEVGNGFDIKGVRGYRKEMELLELERQTKREEFMEEVEELTEHAISKMKVSEKASRIILVGL